jgi:acetyltransferase-like isoleucine patch superfamily enzyme
MSTTDLHPVIASMDALRRAEGLLTIEELLALQEFGNSIYDPFSTLISREVHIGIGNVVHPGVQLRCIGKNALFIGDGNTFHSGTRVEARQGPIRIGHRNEFGDGGFSARTDTARSRIQIGDGGRYTLNCAVTGDTDLGCGSQILGPIAVDSCRLAAGDTHAEPNPDLRGAVLKGVGRARGLVLGVGEVIQGFGVFEMTDRKMQSFFHPSKSP